MKYSLIDYGVAEPFSLLFPEVKKNKKRREAFSSSCAAGDTACNESGFPTPGAPDIEGTSTERAQVKATQVPKEPDVGRVIPTPTQLVSFGKLYTRSDTEDDQEKADTSKEEAAKTPEIDEKQFEKKKYQLPTDEDMDCWLHKWWSLKGGYKGNLQQFKEVMFADGLIDSGRRTGTGVKLMIDNADLWFTIKTRARKHVEYYLENDLDFGDIPEPYCVVEKELTDEEAQDAYEKELEENPAVALLGSSKASAAEEEYGSKEEDDAPPVDCEPKWQYRKCTKADMKTKACKKKKGPEREQCEIDLEGCKEDKDNYCIKRTGWDAFAAFMRKWDNVKLFYLTIILGAPLLTVLFPPAAIITGPLWVFAGVLIPWVIYKHFYRLVGPGSTLFEALPYFIRWYFWYPIILLISKPAKLFKTIGKNVGKFFTKTVPKAFSWLFGKQIPKLVGKILKPIMSIVKTVWDTIQKGLKPIISAFKAIFKMIVKAAETIGNAFAAAWKGIDKIIKGISGTINKIIKSIAKFFKSMKKIKEIPGKISKITKKLFR